jgi:tRNA G46 methylase TrmB
MKKRASGMVGIEDLPHPPEGTPDYVRELISERLDDLKGMPKDAQSLIAQAPTIVDVGPGEGVSSIALAQFAPNARVTGIEMDQRHLQAAWPDCSKFANLELYWGALPGTPSNAQVNEELLTPSSSSSAKQVL